MSLEAGLSYTSKRRPGPRSLVPQLVVGWGRVENIFAGIPKNADKLGGMDGAKASSLKWKAKWVLLFLRTGINLWLAAGRTHLQREVIKSTNISYTVRIISKYTEYFRYISTSLFYSDDPFRSN